MPCDESRCITWGGTVRLQFLRCCWFRLTCPSTVLHTLVVMHCSVWKQSIPGHQSRRVLTGQHDARGESDVACPGKWKTAKQRTTLWKSILVLIKRAYLTCSWCLAAASGNLEEVLSRACHETMRMVAYVVGLSFLGIVRVNLPCLAGRKLL
jgi:hypothetical protein